MQLEQPQFYSSLLTQLSAQDQATIQGVMMKAQQNAMEQMALAEQQGAGLPGQAQQGPAPNGGAS
jgi:hypothetical protein